MNNQPANFRRNFTLGVFNGTFFMAALAFFTGSAVLPVFLSKMTDSRLVIGIFSHLEWFGWSFPQLLAAVFLSHKRRVLPFYNRLSAVRLIILGICVGSIVYFRDNYGAILISFGITFTLFSLSSGLAGTAFMEVVGKTIPLNKRGSFFGLRMFSGGLLAALGGFAIKTIMRVFEFPMDFAYVCGASWFLMLFGLICFALVKEPEGPENPTPVGVWNQFSTAFDTFRRDANFRRLAFSKMWVNSGLMAAPFYVIFAIERLNAPEWMAGTYLTASMIGYLGSNLLWGWLANHISNKKVIVLAGICRTIPAIAAFIVSFIYIDPLVFALVFVFMGMAESGVDMGYMTYLLEILPEKGRILSIGLMQTLVAPTIFFSGLGGWLSQILSLRWLFGIVILTLAVSLLISSSLKEPRVRPS